MIKYLSNKGGYFLLKHTQKPYKISSPKDPMKKGVQFAKVTRFENGAVYAITLEKVPIRAEWNKCKMIRGKYITNRACTDRRLQIGSEIAFVVDRTANNEGALVAYRWGYACYYGIEKPSVSKIAPWIALRQHQSVAIPVHELVTQSFG